MVWVGLITGNSVHRVSADYLGVLGAKEEEVLSWPKVGLKYN